MSYFWMIIKGMLIGIANIIPGVSGGTMAVSLAIYDDLIFAITHIAKEFKKSLKIVAPLAVGVALGIIFFSYAIEILLSDYTFPTAMAFVGLILGGLPVLFKQFQAEKVANNRNLKPMHYVVFALFFILIIWMSLLQESVATFEAIEPSLINLIILFFVGLIAAATMVIPGISGSLVLMILGYYYNIINTLTNFFDAIRAFDFAAMMDGLILLVPLGLGVLAGGFLISKIIEYLFANMPLFTYSAIFGLVLASPIAIFLNTGALASLMNNNTLVFLIVGIVVSILCFMGTYWLGTVEDVEVH